MLGGVLVVSFASLLIFAGAIGFILAIRKPLDVESAHRVDPVPDKKNSSD
ncbi:hypothetical protein [Mangrovibacillus cuniculi]|uniref:Uncharacterized protein n=1 Tax=Mangrovibacillus cuniculi TaxID=2593652 RepID=A0A7S8CDW6_9BACI|nr:hypothetical protein [Mangrovibacillus cuniculi]QPC48183.1 hypothetical protein G8O30_15210 [Mangrovibacillus cuniculi]